MKKTDYLKLNVPELTDSPPDITKLSDNFPKIDANAKSVGEQIKNLEANKADLIDGKIPSNQLPEMNYLSPTGDGKDVTVAFTESGSRININTAEKLSVLFGKIRKYFTDLKTVAFTGSYSDLSGTPISLPANGGTSASCSGNAATATKLQTARQINGVNFDGTANITIPTTDSTKAPINHASTGSSYGVGTSSNYGHVKVRNDLVGTETTGAAVSPAQIKVLNDANKDEVLTIQGSSSTLANYVKYTIGTYSIANILNSGKRYWLFEAQVTQTSGSNAGRSNYSTMIKDMIDEKNISTIAGSATTEDGVIFYCNSGSSGGQTAMIGYTISGTTLTLYGIRGRNIGGIQGFDYVMKFSKF